MFWDLLALYVNRLREQLHLLQRQASPTGSAEKLMLMEHPNRKYHVTHRNYWPGMVTTEPVKCLFFCYRLKIENPAYHKKHLERK